jgi:hypothetical protein
MKKIILIALLFLFPLSVSARKPNDPLVEQWAFEDTGAYEAWDLATGSKDVVVAIIDNGFDTFHPDLYENVWVNPGEIRGNGIDDDDNGYIDDIWGWDFVPEDTNGNNIIDAIEYLGNNDPRPDVTNLSDAELHTGSMHHGTSVAGIIGAKGNNEVDGAGINWDVSMMNLRVISGDGVGTIQYLPSAIMYAVDNGADVINISLVGMDTIQDIEDSINYAYDNGVVVVAAAGNNSVNLNDVPFHPVCSDADSEVEKVIGVSSINKKHYRSLFSNLGTDCIDITAPGEGLSSALRFSPKDGLTERYGDGLSGTSFAAPLVAGAAALVKSVQPTWGASEIIDAILTNIHQTPPWDEHEYAQVYGAGLLQVQKVIKFALAQKNAFHKVENIRAIDTISGVSTNQNEEDAQTKLKESSSVTSYAIDGVKKFASVSQKSRNSSEVVLYDADWKVESSWSVPSLGPLQIQVGKARNIAETSVVLSPQYATTHAFRIFSLSGEELHIEKTAKHAGSYSTLVGIGDEKKQIASVFKTVDGVMLHTYDVVGKENLRNKVLLPFLNNRGVVGSGDVDGNGFQDIVIGGGEGETPWLAIYDPSANVLTRKFWAVDPGYRGGLALEVGDFNKDGADDMIVSKAKDARDASVFNHRAKRLLEWQILPNRAKNKVILLVD